MLFRSQQGPVLRNRKLFSDPRWANVGFVKSVAGGAIEAEVINEPAGPTYFIKKHIGQPKYQDFEVQLGFTMSKAVYDWISRSWAMNYERKDGSIIATDYKLMAKSERQFFQP